MQIDIDYPDEKSEREVLIRTTGPEQVSVSEIMNGDQLLNIQRLVRQIPIGDTVIDAILRLVRSARPVNDSSDIIWGPGPRASQSLALGIRARALIDGRLSPSVDDLVALAKPILRHRMAISFAARADGTTIDGLIDRLVSAI